MFYWISESSYFLGMKSPTTTPIDRGIILEWGQSRQGLYREENHRVSCKDVTAKNSKLFYLMFSFNLHNSLSWHFTRDTPAVQRGG